MSRKFIRQVMNRFVILLVTLAAVAVAPHSREEFPICYDEVLSHPDSFQVPLSENGLWTFWDVEKATFPLQAVFAGPDPYGPGFVMRADHENDNGEHVGKQLGKFFPYLQTAFIGYDGQSIEKTHFELLLHENYAWTDKNDTRTPISSGDRVICRGRVPRNPWIMAPGFIDGDSCRVPYGGEQITLTDYETLRRNCYQN